MWTFKEQWSVDHEGNPMRPLRNYVFINGDRSFGPVKLLNDYHAATVAAALTGDSSMQETFRNPEQGQDYRAHCA